MSLHLSNLDDRTRMLMLDEMEQDLVNGTIYIGKYLNERGQEIYIDLLKKAIEKEDDVALANGLRENSCMKTTVQRKKKGGGYTEAKVPVTAPDTLSEGEFNRFYMRGLCRRAMEDGFGELVIYRAKRVSNPRHDSELKIGTRISAEVLLNDLRNNPGVDTALGLPAGPNSGLSVRLPD